MELLKEINQIEHMNKFKNPLGFQIRGLEKAQTKEQKMEALEKHLSMMEGLTNECSSDLENRISEIKYN